MNQYKIETPYISFFSEQQKKDNTLFKLIENTLKVIIQQLDLVHHITGSKTYPLISFVDCYQNISLLKKVQPAILKNSYVIAIINLSQEHKQQVFQLGAKDYITYPIIHQELEIRLKSMLLLIKQSLQKPIIKTYRRTTQLVETTCQYLLDNIEKKYSLEELSARMCSNRTSLTKAFKKEKGGTVFKWLRLQRMKKAKQLLETTNLSITEISLSVGYDDPANFSTAYRDVNKITPTEYRKQLQASKE